MWKKELCKNKFNVFDFKGAARELRTRSVHTSMQSVVVYSQEKENKPFMMLTKTASVKAHTFRTQPPRHS